MTETSEVSQTIIDQLSEDKWRIIAYNNEFSAFVIVFYVLKTVVPLSEDEAYNKTNTIHEQGECVVYYGSKEHCEKIAKALEQIKVESKIEKND